MRDTARTWIEQGRPHPRLLGSFFRAVLLNNLVDAFACADSENAASMRTWAMFLYNHMPSPAWRTEENLQAWYDVGGLEGMAGGMVSDAAREES
jgi:hypothetical protein